MKFFTSTTNSREKTISAGADKGQKTHSRTWTHGVEIESTVYETQKNSPIGFSIYSTGGSDKPLERTYLGEVVLGKNGTPKFIRAKKWQNN